MISRIRGTVIERQRGRLVVDVGGVGYEVAVTETTERLATDSVDLFIRLICREGEWDLFGFLSPVERDIFDHLRSVAGVGPRTALGLLSVFGAPDLAKTIANRDTKALCSVPGVGAKLAQRISLELADRMAELCLQERAVVSSLPSKAGDVEAALIALGYGKQEARRAAASVAQANVSDGLEELVRKALAIVGGT